MRHGMPILVTGARGTLGAAVVRRARGRGLPVVALTRQHLDAADPAAVAAALAAHRPWGVVNAAGYMRVDDAESDRDACARANADAPEVLARACRAAGVRLATFSTDLVFDGSGAPPYREDDRPAPLNVYGRTKAEGEERVLAVMPEAIVIRTSAFFGPWDRASFCRAVASALRAGGRFDAVADERVSPTWVPDLADATLDLLAGADGAGVHHLAGREAMSWADLARATAESAGLDPAGVRDVPARSLARPARRPPRSDLASHRGPGLPGAGERLADWARSWSGGAAD